MSDAPTSRRYPVILVLCLVLVLALGSFWSLEVTRRSAQNTAPAAARSAPDYFIENFRFAKIAANGKAEYLITGELLTHYPLDDSNTIDNPLLKRFYDQRPPISVTAKRAKINKDQSEIHLYDQVKLEKPASPNSNSYLVESEYMLALPDDDLVKTDKPVMIRMGMSTLTGVGMIADNSKQALTLESNTHATYVPAPRRK